MFRLFALSSFLCLWAVYATGQSSKPTVKVSIHTPSEVQIHISDLPPAASWSFRNSYAGALGLGEKISGFQAKRFDERLLVKTITPGEYRSEKLAENVTYLVSIPPSRSTDLAHVSWLTGESGLLMLADLLPESLSAEHGAVLEFDLPIGWAVHSHVMPDEGQRYSVDQVAAEVFFVGRGLRVASKIVRDMNLQVVIDTKLMLNETDVLKAAARVLEEYSDLTRFKLRQNPTILVASFPVSDSDSRWKSETRGSSVMLLLNQETLAKNWRAQLAVIFTHEIFHWWVPNSLLLTGNYDWFFEGFTLYVGLQAALRLKLIGFEEYLATLSRVYDSYLSYPDEQTLIEASEKRWTSSNPIVYDKGMLAAFVYDLTRRSATKGKTGLGDQYRAFFSQLAGEPANANDVIIRLLTSSPETAGFSKSYIESRNRIELEKILTPFGLAVETTGRNSHINVRKQLTDDQKRLLRSLGYRK
ncbi:MAG TPA: hypothetical protein VGQ39_18030 [Pyrinomonadaceae bacterium]|jgi:hypothetical protein|nr:hypothetical protein [Pyrinomonadaceae bacterium]